jgi:hypothetical protein
MFQEPVYLQVINKIDILIQQKRKSMELPYPTAVESLNHFRKNNERHVPNILRTHQYCSYGVVTLIIENGIYAQD